MSMETEAEQTEPTREDMEFLGALVSANVAAANHTTNLLLKNREDEIKAWKKHFQMLYNSMSKVRERTDSATARYALDRFEYLYDSSFDTDEYID